MKKSLDLVLELNSNHSSPTHWSYVVMVDYLASVSLYFTNYKAPKDWNYEFEAAWQGLVSKSRD